MGISVQVDSIMKADEIDAIIVLALFASAAFVAEGVSYMTYIKDINEESR